MKTIRMLGRHLMVALIAVVATTPACFAADLKVGDAAPVFAAMDDTGKEWKSTEAIGKQTIVVYFYPADMTGGCTKQACGFRDDLGKLADKGSLSSA